MHDIMQIADWFCEMYRRRFHVAIDEMKLHKLLYLAQRESFIECGSPLFKDEFSAWKYGPVMVKIRDAFRTGRFAQMAQFVCQLPNDVVAILQTVFDNYAWKNSWSLSRLTHSETSWQKARGDLDEWQHGDGVIKTADIRIDAQRVAARRQMLSLLGV